MKLLIVTQYFPPEIGAPQNRLFELAIRLQKSGMDISILTAMPNYPQMEIHEGYLGKKYVFETEQEIKIHRASIYTTKSKKIVSRLRNYFSFVWSSYWIGKKKLDKNYDIVLCESPPLFLGISAYKLAKAKNAKFIFNVSDLWPESAEKMEIVTNKLFLKLATYLEEFLYKKSDLITAQTQGIEKNIKSRLINKEIYWLPNGVDLSYYDPAKYEDSNWRTENNFSNNDTLFFYGGILGHAQGLEVIIKAANLVNNENFKFIFMGSGPEKESLQSLAEELKLTNIYFLPPSPKSKMPYVLSAIDISIIPLRKLDLFLGAIPSKIFECLAMEVPILLGVDGEAKDLFITEGNAGFFYEPENETELVNAINKITTDQNQKIIFGRNGREYVNRNFNRNNIAKDFSKEIYKLMSN